MGRRIRQLESELSDAHESNRKLRKELSDRDAAAAEGSWFWAQEDRSWRASVDTKNARIAELIEETRELEVQRDEAHRIVRLLAGKLLRTGVIGEIQKPDVKIPESEARRIMADERRPAVMHDQLTGKTVVRLVEPGNPRPWDEVPR